ncbi:MAG TPA: type II secretion system protein [Thermoanaerobaculia bacterium]|nr:type II secretion system protein [Thermoanaerobaculia bacterium]
MGKLARTSSGRRPEAGFSLPELLVVISLSGLVALVALPAAGKIIRHSRDLGAFASVRQVLATARLQAVKHGANVVVEIRLTPEKQIQLRTFKDRANDTAMPLPADELAAAGNFVQNTFTDPIKNEPTLGDFVVQGVSLWKQGGTKDDLGAAAAFDKYAGDASLVDRIVFLPGGGIVPPQDSGCGLPTSSGGRGIYFADSDGKNFFRVTVDSNLSGKFRVDKYVPGTGYVSSGWTWS